MDRPNRTDHDNRSSMEDQMFSLMLGDINFRQMDRDCSEDDDEEVNLNSSDEEALPTSVSAYAHEPRMTPERKAEKERLRNEREEYIKKKRLPKEYWCVCTLCEPTGNPEEHVCCQEDCFAKIRTSEADIICITKHDAFYPILNVHVLDVMRQQVIGFHKKFGNKEEVTKLRSSSNESYRYLAYRSLRTWLCKGERLGKGKRMVTPACALKEIRSMWPSDDGTYKGFDANNFFLGDDDDDTQFDL